MFEKAKQARDAFTFSLGGARTVSSYFAMPAVNDDRINTIRDAHLSMLEARRSEADRHEERPAPEVAELCTQNA